jgi:hypothetical protein
MKEAQGRSVEGDALDGIGFGAVFLVADDGAAGAGELDARM